MIKSILTSACCVTALVFATVADAREEAAAKSKASNPAGPQSERILKPATGPLPEAALKRAQEAEKLLAADKPTDALASLTKLDHEFPGHAAISLRLAQIYDIIDTPGPALFFYRRYAVLAGDRAREEGTARLASLELTPGAPEAASSFAQKMHEPTIAAATPVAVAKHEVAAARDDGTLFTLRGPEDVKELVKAGGPPPATPSPVTSPTPNVISIESLKKAAQNASAARGDYGQNGLVLSGTGDNVSVTQGALTPATPAIARATSNPEKNVYAAGTPESGVDEDAQLARAFSKGSARVTPASAVPQPQAPVVVQPPMQPQLTPLIPPAETVTPAGSPEIKSTMAPSGPGSVAYINPTPVRDVISPRADKFFNTTKVGGATATVKLINDLPEAVITIKIIPEDDGDAINAILTKDEKRTLQVPAGSHDVHVNVATTNYPPLPLLETQFKQEFEAGTQYLRRFNSENVQQMR